MQSTSEKLLPPKRRKQIETWLGETVQHQALQTCATDRRFGHASDHTISSAHKSRLSRPISTLTTCPVCGRCFHGEESSSSHSAAKSLPKHPLDNIQPIKNKTIFRGLRSAITSLKPKDVDKTYDPALSTKMFLISPSDNEAGSNSTSSVAGLGSSKDNDDGNRALDEKMRRLRRAQKLMEKSRPT